MRPLARLAVLVCRLSFIVFPSSPPPRVPNRSSRADCSNRPIEPTVLADRSDRTDRWSRPFEPTVRTDLSSRPLEPTVRADRSSRPIEPTVLADCSSRPFEPTDRIQRAGFQIKEALSPLCNRGGKVSSLIWKSYVGRSSRSSRPSEEPTSRADRSNRPIEQTAGADRSNRPFEPTV